MELSQCFQSTRHASASPSGKLIATVHQSHLIVRSAIDYSVTGTILLPKEVATQCKFLQWYTHRNYALDESSDDGGDTTPKHRLLIASDDAIHIYDAQDLHWHAEISGASSNTGRIVRVETGHTPDEVLVFSDLGIKATIWSLITGRGVEIKDPKFPDRSHCFRPRSGHLAILTRPVTRDVVMILAPRAHEFVNSFTLATTDAQGLKWSPDGMWLATWDAASFGFALYVYSVDGHLFKTYLGGQDVETPGLGIRLVEWDPSGRYIAIGSCAAQITLLDCINFNPLAMFSHSTTISSPNACVWQEQIDASKDRSYVLCLQPACPPTQSSEDYSTADISHMTFNIDGTLLASCSHSTSSTIWIWSLHSLSPIAILIHHSPVKRLRWHPVTPSLLMIHCASNESILHIWNSDWHPPQILKIPLLKSASGRTEATWLHTSSNNRPKILYGNAQNHVICNILREGETITDLATSLPLPASSSIEEPYYNAGPEDMFDEGNSMDLSPVKFSNDHFTKVMEGVGIGGSRWDSEEVVEDTFAFKKHLAAAATAT